MLRTVAVRFRGRVDAPDPVGHRGFAESTGSGPMPVDRSGLCGRIIGLDLEARDGLGPVVQPVPAGGH